MSLIKWGFWECRVDRSLLEGLLELDVFLTDNFFLKLVGIFVLGPLPGLELGVYEDGLAEGPETILLI